MDYRDNGPGSQHGYFNTRPGNYNKPIFEGEPDPVDPPVKIYHTIEEIQSIFKKHAGPEAAAELDRRLKIFRSASDATATPEEEAPVPELDPAKQAFLRNELRWFGLGLFLVGLLLYIFSRLGPG